MAFDATAFEIDPQSLTTPRARLEYLRDFLRRLPRERFNMGYEGDTEDAESGSCGTPACIMGWGRALFRHEGYTTVGLELLGLSPSNANRLFFPGTYSLADGTQAYDAHPADAAAVLDHLINTGEVDWSVARKAEAA